MPEDKKTQIGTINPTPRAHSATGAQAVPATGTPVPTAPTPTPATDPAPPAPPAPPASAAAASHATSYLPPAAPTVDPLIGQLLAGRYTITKKLGEGGMGAVYLATHNLLEKQVALKLLHAEFSRKPDLVERFMQEAKSASRIRHENVIDISDFGTTADGQVFFAMELLKGHDLHEEIARARLAGQLLPWSRSKRIFLQICSALTAAHGKGIVHRDLKPENIYLVDFLGEPDFVKLLDFGIAKLTEVNEDGRKLTKTGMLFGTPEYMSPEQARGENVDHRVDVYAMGCILFQLVTGRVPFEADNFMGVLSMHLTEPPPAIPPDVFDKIGAPRELAQVIDKALSKDRNERYQTMEDLANAVRRVSGDAIPAPGTEARHTPAPMVAAPTHTTESRQNTGLRQKTQWTGNLNVPTDDGAPRGKSKLPMLITILVILGGGAAAGIYVVKSRQSSTPPVSEPSGSAVASNVGSNPVPVGSNGSNVAANPPPVPLDAGVATVEAPLPKKAAIHLDSVPSGALLDVGDGIVHHTPLNFTIDGSHKARQFSIKLAGYQEAMIEIVPDQAEIMYTEKLIKGAGSGTAVVHQVPHTPPGAGSGSGSAIGVVTRPDPAPRDAGVKIEHTHPGSGSAAPCMPDPNDPNGGCLKSFPGGPAGGG